MDKRIKKSFLECAIYFVIGAGSVGTDMAISKFVKAAPQKHEPNKSASHAPCLESAFINARSGKTGSNVHLSVEDGGKNQMIVGAPEAPCR
ncbi:MAG: hypothetical protein ACT4OY_08260 [Alphaproteobacteria bacterium]